eukprot:jgi/Chrzof1/2786/Cz11g29110.t1
MLTTLQQLKLTVSASELEMYTTDPMQEVIVTLPSLSSTAEVLLGCSRALVLRNGPALTAVARPGIMALSLFFDMPDYSQQQYIRAPAVAVLSTLKDSTWPTCQLWHYSVIVKPLLFSPAERRAELVCLSGDNSAIKDQMYAAFHMAGVIEPSTPPLQVV